MRYTTAIIISLLLIHIPARAQWEMVSHISTASTQGAQTFASDGRVLFVGTGELGLLKSLDSGRTWTVSLDSIGIVSLLFDNGDLYAGTSRIGLLRSHDLGATWPDTLRRSGEIKYIVRLGNNLVYSVFGGGINVSTDNGASWTTTLDAGFSAIIATNGRDAYANADKNFYHSSDFGLSWQKMGAIPGGVYDLAIIGNHLFLAAGSAPNMVSSVDSGKTWTTTSKGIPNNALLYVHRFGVIGNTLIAGTNQGAFVSSDLGQSWNTFNSGISDPYLWPVVPALGYVYSGDTQIIRIPVSQIPQNKNAVATQRQDKMTMAVFPNPARSDVNFCYSVQSTAVVSINVIDATGRVVSSSTEFCSEGARTYHWSRPEGLAPGVYECLISANGKTQSIKFVVE